MQLWGRRYDAARHDAVRNSSALTIPPRSSALHRVLQHRNVFPIVASEKKWTKLRLIKKLSNAAQIGAVDKNAILTIETAPENELLRAIIHVTEQPPKDLTVDSMKLKEVSELKRSAVEGAPPAPSKVSQDFEVIVDDVVSFPLPGGLE